MTATATRETNQTEFAKPEHTPDFIPPIDTSREPKRRRREKRSSKPVRRSVFVAAIIVVAVIVALTLTRGRGVTNSVPVENGSGDATTGEQPSEATDQNATDAETSSVAEPLGTPPTNQAVVAVIDRTDPEVVYVESWRAYEQAMRTGSATGLEQWYADDALAARKHDVNAATAAQRTVNIDVTHEFEIVEVTDTTAILVDRYQNRSSYVDPTIGQAEVVAPEELTETFTLQRLPDRTWRVAYFTAVGPNDRKIVTAEVRP